MKRRVYRLVSAEGLFELMRPAHAEDWDRLGGPAGRPLSREWSPLEVYVLRKDERGALRRADIPQTNTRALVFSSEVVQQLRPVLEPYVELLPTSCRNDDRDFFVINPLVSTSSFDEHESVFRRSIYGQIYLVRKWMFDADRLEDDLVVFFVADNPGSEILFTDAFAEQFRISQLSGYELEELWVEP